MTAGVSRAKITVPALPREHVARTALVAELTAVAADAIVLLCAPAGFGKTLLLAEWVGASVDADTAWVRLDADDNDPRRLWTSVVAALGAASGSDGGALSGIGPWQAGAHPEFLAALTEEIRGLRRPVRLVLDDVHELFDHGTLRGVELLLRDRPPGLQVVLSSRFDPPLSLTRVRLAGRLFQLRADRLRLGAAEVATLLDRSGTHLDPSQVDALLRRTGGWAAGVRLASLALADADDPDRFLADFSGNDRSVADYLVGEILSRLPEDIQDFLRVISVSDPIPATLAAELTAREDAWALLDELEHQTSLVSATASGGDTYHIQELLRTYLSADLQRQGATRASEVHAAAARWWAAADRPIMALDHAVRAANRSLLAEMLHRFAVPLIVCGDHEPLRRAMAVLGESVTVTDPWLSAISALSNVEAGRLPAAERDLRNVRAHLPDNDFGQTDDLKILLSVAEELSAGTLDHPARDRGLAVDVEPAEPQMRALAGLSRGIAALLRRNDRSAARRELEAALALGREHGFSYLVMQCRTLLGIVAASDGEFRAMRTWSDEALADADGHDWDDSAWSAAAAAMVSCSALLQSEPLVAERLSASALRNPHSAVSPALRFALETVHGAAVHDRGQRADGLAELQHARTAFGSLAAGTEQITLAGVLEFRAALVMRHWPAARTAYGWLTGRVDGVGELALLRAWMHAASGRAQPARLALRPILSGATRMALPHTMVDAYLLEVTLALDAGERFAAREALQRALAVAEPLDVLRPFAFAAPEVADLLMLQHGGFGPANAFAARALAVRTTGDDSAVALTERERTVFSLLPSLLPLDEIAGDLGVSVNTVKSQVRSIYSKLGVRNRRRAVLVGREQGLLTDDALVTAPPTA